MPFRRNRQDRDFDSFLEDASGDTARRVIVVDTPDVDPGPIQFRRDGSAQEVIEDTGTPANNRPLPVKLTGITGDVSINASNLNLDVQLDAAGADPDSVRIGDGTETVDINASNEMQVRDDDANTTLSSIDTNIGDIESAVLDLPAVSDSGTTAVVSISTTEVEITAAAGQQAMTITSLGTGSVFVSLDTGVSSSNKRLRRFDELVLTNYASSVFLIRTAGSSDVQVDRFIKT